MAASDAVRDGVLKRAPRKDSWTKTKRATFLGMLEATCNVTVAARSVGLSDRSARALRKRDGEFAALWAEVLENGYERLQNALVACALGQIPNGDNPMVEEIAVPAEVRPFDPQLALQVLKLRHDRLSAGRAGRGNGRGVRPARTQSEVDAALLKRLDALAARRQRERAVAIALTEQTAGDNKDDDTEGGERA